MGEKRFTAKKLAVLGVLTALSLITFLIENLFPPLIIPGAKLGLANAFSFIALVMFSPLEAFIIVGVRTILGAVFAGNISAVLYSFTGGVVSMAVSSVLMYCVHPKISLICVSVVAAAFHNFTQNAVFVLLSSTPLAFYYAPYLILLGVLSGAFIGAAVTLIVKRVPTKVFVRVTGLTNNNQQKNIEEGTIESN
ncbi:MAG: Gx transporter family protein [Clostridia bacterium]|nr:Gx transporter family protein [Clostridia bacterium]